MNRAIPIIIFTLWLAGCVTSLNDSAKPAQHAAIDTPITHTFRDADIDNDGQLDSQEMELAGKLEQSQESTFPPYLSAFIAIVTAVVGATIIGMVVSGFRGRPKGVESPPLWTPSDEETQFDELGNLKKTNGQTDTDGSNGR